MSAVDVPDDEELVKRVVGHTWPRKRMPRWAMVKDVFLVGSTTAAALCKRFGFDPDETIGGAVHVRLDRGGME